MGGGGEAFSPFGQLLLLKQKQLTKKIVTISLAAWLNFDQLSCNFDNIGA